jgi:hypothetical protein
MSVTSPATYQPQRIGKDQTSRFSNYSKRSHIHSTRIMPSYYMMAHGLLKKGVEKNVGESKAES